MKSVTKTFTNKTTRTTRSVIVSKMKDGRYLVFAQNFEEKYGVERFIKKDDAITHANVLIKVIENSGFQLKS